MPSRVNEISPVLIDLEIEIPWEQVHKELESAYTKLQRTARIRGYRPGKVPRNVVRQLLGKGVKEEVRSALVEEGLSQAVQEHALEPVAIPKYEPSEMADGKPFSFAVKMEVRPKIASVDLSSLEVERVMDEVTDKAVDAHIEQLRINNAELVAPDPMRPAQAGDVLTVDYKVLVEGKEKPDLGVTARRMELGANQLIEAFDKGLLGVSPGETKSITVRYPEDFPRQDVRGVEAQVEVTVKELSEKRLPALDDEFAKDVSYESLEILKSGVREKLETESRERAESAVRTQLIEKLVAKNPIPIPPSLVDQQEKALFNELIRFQQMFGQQTPMTDEISATLREQAEQKVRAAFLLNKIAIDQKIGVTDDEMDEKLDELAESRGVHPAKLRANYTDKMKETLHAQLMEEKLVAYLLTQATVKETVKPLESGSQETGK